MSNAENLSQLAKNLTASTNGDVVTTTTPTPTDNSKKIINTEWALLGFAISLNTNGYIKLPTWLGGLIIQWGYSVASTGGSAVSFPLTFPNACLQIAIGQAGAGGVTYIGGTPTTTSFTFYNTAGTGSHRWIAIGH